MSAVTDSGAGRVLGALAAPGDTFRSIAARPTWAAPLLALVLAVTVTGSMVAARVDLTAAVRQRVEAAGGPLTAEQLAPHVETAKKLAPWLALFSGLIGAPTGYLLLALLLWVGCKLVGSELSYRGSLAITLHGLLPFAVWSLLAIAVLWNRPSLTLDEERSGSYVLSNLAAVAPAGTGKVALTLLGSVDLFSIWAIVLLIVGCRIVARVSRAAAVGVVLSLWLLGVAIKAALAALAPG
jgi:hypothetical protein